MELSNFQRSLQAFQKQTPFRPFTVALSNGDRFQVDHPEALVVRAGVAVFIAADGQPWLFDNESVSQFNREPSSQKSGRKGNSDKAV